MQHCNYAQILFPSGRGSTVPLRDIAPVGEFEPGSPEQNEANAEAGNEAAQAVHDRSTLCRVTVNMLKMLLVIPPHRRAPVAAMIAQFYKAAVIERKKACVQTLNSHLPPLCAGPHGHGNLWIATCCTVLLRLRLKGR